MSKTRRREGIYVILATVRLRLTPRGRQYVEVIYIVVIDKSRVVRPVRARAR